MLKEKMLLLEKIVNDEEVLECMKNMKTLYKSLLEAKNEMERCLYRNNLYNMTTSYMKKLRDRINENNFTMSDFNGEKTRQKIKDLLSNDYFTCIISTDELNNLDIKVYKEKRYSDYQYMQIMYRDYKDNEIKNTIDYVVREQRTLKEYKQVASEIQEKYNKIKSLFNEIDGVLSRIDLECYSSIYTLAEQIQRLNKNYGFNLKD